MPYDATTAEGRSKLSQSGVVAGKFMDGTIAYIGAGPNPKCIGENPCPARRE